MQLGAALVLLIGCCAAVDAFSGQPLGLGADGAARVLRCGRAPRQAFAPALRMKEDGDATKVRAAARSTARCIPAAQPAPPRVPRAQTGCLQAPADAPPPAPEPGSEPAHAPSACAEAEPAAPRNKPRSPPFARGRPAGECKRCACNLRA